MSSSSGASEAFGLLHWLINTRAMQVFRLLDFCLLAILQPAP